MLYCIVHNHEYGATPYYFDWQGKEPPEINRLCVALDIEFEHDRCDEYLESFPVESDPVTLTEGDYDRCEYCTGEGVFCSGVEGILAMMHEGKVAEGATVERCDACCKYASDEEAQAEMVRLGLYQSLASKIDEQRV